MSSLKHSLFFVDPPLWVRTEEIMPLSSSTSSKPRAPRRKVLQCHCENPTARKLRHFNPVDCNPQEKCPLFKKIPPEIRNHIFNFVLAPQEGEAIDEGEFWYRPDFSRHYFIDTAVLRTCRRIYFETRSIPVTRDSVLRIWLGWIHGWNSRAPAKYQQIMLRDQFISVMNMKLPNRSNGTQHYSLGNSTPIAGVDFVVNDGNDNAAEYFTSLNHEAKLRKKSGKVGLIPRNSNSVCQMHFPQPGKVQVFAQQFLLDLGRMQTLFTEKLLPNFNVKHLTLTLRYSDWWNWEVDAPLHFKANLPNVLKLSASIETFTLELETRNGKREELDQLIESQCSNWVFQTLSKPLDPSRTTNSGNFVYKLSNKVAITWIGSSHVGKSEWPHEHHSPARNGTPDLPDDKLKFYVTKLTYTKHPKNNTTG